MRNATFLTFIFLCLGTLTALQAQDKNNRLSGVLWILEQPAFPGHKDINLEVAADGSGISGNSGCNRYSASLRLKDHNFDVAQLIRTEMACEGPRMKSEDQFLSLIAKVRLYRVNAKTLILLDSRGKRLLRFTRFR